MLSFLAVLFLMVSVNAEVKSNGVMTHAEYVSAELDSQVIIETYIQARQSWWNHTASFYTQDKDGAYFLYHMQCTEDEYARLTKGTKIRVHGYKAEWAGQIEIVDATFEIMEDEPYIAESIDVTGLLGSDELILHQSRLVFFRNMTVVPSENGHAFMYGWDGSGSRLANSDLYFSVSKNGKTYQFTVESYLCDNTTEVYATVENLKAGDTIDMEGFLYWYNGPNPHIVSLITRKANIVLPAGLKMIDAEAFEGSGIESVEIPDACENIASRAFADCKNLIKVVFPDTEVNIAIDAFDGCDQYVKP